MPRLPSRASRCAAAAAVTGACFAAAVVPLSHAAAAPARPSRTVHHANLLSAVQSLPDYFPGIVHWKLSTSWKHYGTTDWYTDTITISAFTPLNLLYSVVAHEWSHVVQAYDYHPDFAGLVKSLDRHFGGGGKTGERGVEYAADCMAILQGATWTDYTPCTKKKWRGYAKRLLEGHRLKALPSKHKSTKTDTSSSGAVTYGTPPEPDQ